MSARRHCSNSSPANTRQRSPELKIGITDSGVGGLSVCAELETRLRESPIEADLEILYLNAAIEDDYAYNSMPDRETKLLAFNRFLTSVVQRYELDLLFIACNTLSVLYQDPYFDHHRHIPIKGIVDTGVQEMRAVFKKQPDTTNLVFATPTTIKEGVYGKRLRQHGVPPGQVIEQACPGLPDAISNDGSGQLARQLLEQFVPAALKQTQTPPESVVAFLGCTHYGYQARQFEQVLLPLVPNVKVLNPNRAAVDTILSMLNPITTGNGSLDIHFITRYEIPGIVMQSLSGYIGSQAPRTLSALQNFTLLPELCGDLKSIT